jgi:hypothetical protein
MEDRSVNDRAFADALRRRLAAPLPGLDAQLRMSPRPRLGADWGVDVASLRPAAALLLIYPHEDVWHVPLTVPRIRSASPHGAGLASGRTARRRRVDRAGRIAGISAGGG